MKLSIKNKRAFTIIELIVVMAIIGILVLLAIPKFMGHTKEAKYTKLIANTTQIEKASERYYIDKNDWPRLSDVPYTSAQITAYAQKIYDTTGKEAILDTSGNYYDIDFSKLSQYIHIPDNGMDYVIQNPVGNVYALENLTKSAETRLINVKVIGLTLDKTVLAISTGSTQTLMATIQPSDATNKTVIWSSSNIAIATVSNSGVVTGISSGSTVITGTTQDGNYIATSTMTVSPPFVSKTFAYTGNVQSFTVPTTGRYNLEVWGSKGGGYGGYGGYSNGTILLTSGQIASIYVGGIGSSAGGFNGGGSGYYTGGGGATDVRINGTSLSNRIIVAGGGGGGNTRDGGVGGGLSGGASYGGGSGGTQTAGGSGYRSGTFGQGGASTGGNVDNHGGGGGGWYGGGGGAQSGGYNGSGGGGSSYIGGVDTGSTTPGTNNGAGKAIITYVGQ